MTHYPVADEAAGPPLLIVPGAFSDADSFEALAMWFAERGRETHVLSPPQRGSRVPQLDLGGFEALDRSLDLACDRIGDPVTVVGHSLGGLAVLRLLTRRPVSAAVLLAPVPPTGLAPDVLRLLRSQPLDALKMLGISISAWPIRKLPGRPPRGMLSESATPSAIEASSARRVSESWRLLLESMAGSRAEVGPVQTPVLLVGGRQDSIVSAETVAKLAESLAAPYLEFDVAHAFPEEPGLELVLEPVSEWLGNR